MVLNEYTGVCGVKFRGAARGGEGRGSSVGEAEKTTGVAWKKPGVMLFG